MSKRFTKVQTRSRLEALRRFDRAEFRARVDEWLVLFPYSPAEVAEFTERVLVSDVAGTYSASNPDRKISLSVAWTAPVVHRIVQRYGGDEGKEGFRPLLRYDRGVL